MQYPWSVEVDSGNRRTLVVKGSCDYEHEKVRFRFQKAGCVEGKIARARLEDIRAMDVESNFKGVQRWFAGKEMIATMRLRSLAEFGMRYQRQSWKPKELSLKPVEEEEIGVYVTGANRGKKIAITALGDPRDYILYLKPEFPLGSRHIKCQTGPVPILVSSTISSNFPGIMTAKECPDPSRFEKFSRVRCRMEAGDYFELEVPQQGEVVKEEEDTAQDGPVVQLRVVETLGRKGGKHVVLEMICGRADEEEEEEKAGKQQKKRSAKEMEEEEMEARRKQMRLAHFSFPPGPSN